MILVDLKGERQKELKIQENRGGKIVFPLRRSSLDMLKERGDKFNVIINADKEHALRAAPTGAAGCAPRPAC